MPRFILPRRLRAGAFVVLAGLLALQGLGFATATGAAAATGTRPDRVVHVDPADEFPEPAQSVSRYSTAASATGPPCSASHPNGFQMLYARASDTPSRFASLQSAFLDDAAASSARVSAESNPAAKRPRFFCGITEVAMSRLNAGYLADPFNTIVADLDARGYNLESRKYVVWWDGEPEPGTCGVGSFYRDDRADPAVNWNNLGPDYAMIFTRSGSFCGWNVVLHEMMHTLGSVLRGAANSTENAHCTDGRDIMCYVDGPGVIVDNNVCPGTYEYLDCGKNDYFSPNPAPGSYLANFWNTYNSSWLEPTSSAPTNPAAPETSITQKPAAFGTSSSATFAFSSSVAGSTFTCVVDGGAPNACVSPVTYSGLAQEAHAFSVFATAGGLDDTTPATHGWTIDTAVPTVTLTAPGSIMQSSRRITVGWSASDASPITHQLWSRSASTTSGFSSYALLRQQSSPGYVFDGLLGRTYCFKVKAIDAAGNATWSGERCAAVPLDDWAGTVSNVSRTTGASFYNGTVSVGRVSNGRIAFSNLRAKYLTVRVQMCSTCKYLDVYWNGVRFKQMSLYSSTAKWVHVPLRSFSSVTTGKLEFVVRTPIGVVDFVGVSQV